MLMFKYEDYPFMLQRIAPEDGGGWLITWPDLPDCFSSGDTVEAAIEHGRDAVLSYLEILAETNRPIPAPNAGNLIHLPSPLHHQLAKQAQDNGIPLNLLVNDWLNERVRQFP